MNPGTLDRKIQIQRATATADSFNQQVETWTVWKTRMAKRIESKGRERSDNSREASFGAVIFKMRYTRGIKAADRLVDTRDGQAYDIEDFIGDEREGWMEIHSTRHRTPENENQSIPELQPDAMVVEDAGTESARGVYPRSGDSNSRPKFTLEGPSASAIYTIDLLSDGSNWHFDPSSSGWLYSSTDHPPLPSEANFEKSAYYGNPAELPAPTVRRATWADINAAGIDRSTVPTL